jgi:hypothetical protein
MMGAIMVLTVVLALAVASTLSGPRGPDLPAAKTMSEAPMTNKAASTPDDGESEGPIDRHVAEMIGSLAEVSVMAKERPGPIMTAVHDTAIALMNLLTRAALLGEEGAQSKFQPTHAAVLKYMANPGVPSEHALIFSTPREFREQLLKTIPLCFGGSHGVPFETACDIVASVIMKGSSVNNEVAKLTFEGVRANLLRNLAAHPVPANGKPEDMVEAVLRAAELPSNTIDNIVDGGQRMKKRREGKRSE